MTFDAGPSFIDPPAINSRSGLNSAMRAEMNAVMATPPFPKSPVISKLFAFLVEQTLAGQSEGLKSYTIAVEALGRSPDFDANHDSYARVQMVRLRALLESHYAHHGPVDQLCLYMMPGHYAVRCGSLSQAYPQLYRPLSETPTKPTPAGLPVSPEHASLRTPAGNSAEQAAATSARPYLRLAITGADRQKPMLAAFGGLVIAIAGLLAWQFSGSGNRSEFSPVLALMPITVGPATGESMEPVLATFADGLQRFELSRVRLARLANPSAPKGSDRADYRLDIQLNHMSDGSAQVFLQLTDEHSGTLFWTREARLEEAPASFAENIAPLVAEISGPYGAIAAHDTMLLGASNKSGYPCLLKYLQFLRSRDIALEANVAKCLEQPVAEKRLLPEMLAIRSFFALEGTRLGHNFNASMVTARRFAKEAIKADPGNAYARFAMSRLAYFDQDCKSAVYFTEQAIEANPNEPIILAVLASQAHRCDYPGAAELLDRALLVTGDNDTYSRLFLLLALVAQDQTDRINEIKDLALPNDGNNLDNYYLSETIIAAAKNQSGIARRYWTKFSRALPRAARSDDDKLRHIILSPALRNETLDFLTDKQILPI
jgi:hypothetical protein